MGLLFAQWHATDDGANHVHTEFILAQRASHNHTRLKNRNLQVENHAADCRMGTGRSIAEPDSLPLALTLRIDNKLNKGCATMPFWLVRVHLTDAYHQWRSRTRRALRLAFPVAHHLTLAKT